jgi:hypothetical protein
MKTKPTHTPTPWTTGLYDASVAFTQIGVHVAVCKPDLSLLAVCGPARDEQSEADAAFLVRAVNAHEELVSLLKTMEYMAPNTELNNRIKKAIAKAEGR